MYGGEAPRQRGPRRADTSCYPTDENEAGVDASLLQSGQNFCGAALVGSHRYNTTLTRAVTSRAPARFMKKPVRAMVRIGT